MPDFITPNMLAVVIIVLLGALFIKTSKTFIKVVIVVGVVAYLMVKVLPEMI